MIFYILLYSVWFALVNAGSHSLWLFATYIMGQTPFPEFSAVCMLDDIPVVYYYSGDQGTGWSESTRSGVSDNSSDNHVVSTVFGDMHKQMKWKAQHLRSYFNLTTGVHVQQRLVGCERLENTPGQMMTMEAFNGYGGFERHYDSQQGMQKTEWRWPIMKSQHQLDYDKWLYANVFHPMCLSQLSKYLAKVKNRVMGKVKPRVRLILKTLPDSRGAKVTCLATGFYPRHINLTLLRDGQPVPDHQITGGELLPNADETYQMRKSLEVSAEELQQHHYTCTAEHLSLDNKLDIDFDAGSDHVPVISSLLVVAGLGLFGATIASLIICKKTRAGQGSYSSPHIATSDQIETSLDTVS
ncbi:hypothetical protein ACEWY4_011957 [Coilia grayii]|uniref:Ig-like domain-containing protein n=1 Tax=Coilia grayii TaxID=363190 RepID=A0ABD1JZ56_9TELE